MRPTSRLLPQLRHAYLSTQIAKLHILRLRIRLLWTGERPTPPMNRASPPPPEPSGARAGLRAAGPPGDGLTADIEGPCQHHVQPGLPSRAQTCTTPGGVVARKRGDEMCTFIMKVAVRRLSDWTASDVGFTLSAPCWRLSSPSTSTGPSRPETQRDGVVGLRISRLAWSYVRICGFSPSPCLRPTSEGCFPC
jgi:hypothetical protein